jgi:hypothetical protein
VGILPLRGNILATVTRRNIIDTSVRALVSSMGLRDQLPVNCSSLFIRSIVDMHSNLIAELLANLFKR